MLSAHCILAMVVQGDAKPVHKCTKVKYTLPHHLHVYLCTKLALVKYSILAAKQGSHLISLKSIVLTGDSIKLPNLSPVL